MVVDAVRCHFDEVERPQLVRPSPQGEGIKG